MAEKRVSTDVGLIVSKTYYSSALIPFMLQPSKQLFSPQIQMYYHKANNANPTTSMQCRNYGRQCLYDNTFKISYFCVFE